MSHTVTVAVEAPRQPELIALLEGGAAYARALYPPEETFLLDVESLERPAVRVYVARDEKGTALGMAALVSLTGPTEGTGTTGTPGAVEAEVKRMFVHPEGRGRGVATALLARLEADAAASGITRIVLETGTKHDAALALYTRCGYGVIARFGPYRVSPSSICMAKNLR